jgi:aspartyl-tRNA(Asn)/glutamyl-tRNA(Gln) amidotransferase subunit B
MLNVFGVVSPTNGPALRGPVFRSSTFRPADLRPVPRPTMSYTTVIGLEVHVQLLTRSKLFCGCVNRFNPERPNTQTCPVCLGLPGALPVLNGEAVRLGAKIGLASNCTLAGFSKWDRKQYFYPDLPKAYQISQYDLPLAADGFVEIVTDNETGATRRVGIIRAHLEEDAGKNLHDESGRGGDSRVDLNRCGTPLMEIVTQPDLRSAAEAKTFLEELRLLLVYLGVSDCNMQEGSLRCDANVNLHVDTADGHRIATPITEIKNLNSFRNVEAAIEHEAERQFDEWRETGRKLGDPGVVKQTRGWDAGRGATFPQREKEEEADYRYFPDPDLVPVTLTGEQIESLRSSLCEFPADRRMRFRTAYLLSDYDAAVIIDQGREFADYFETVATACHNGKLAANWVTQDVQRELNDRGITVGEFPVPAAVLGSLLQRIANDEITTKSGREVFAALLEESDNGSPIDADRVTAIIEDRGLAIVTDSGELEAVIAAVIQRNAATVEDVRNGKQAAVGPLIGQVMKEMKGADAKTVRQMLLDRIGNS